MTDPASEPVPGGPPARGPEPGSVSPWQETVRLSPPPGAPRRSDEPPLPEEARSAPAAARFGKFIRTMRLGAGGMGEVWKAWDTVLGRWVALKFLKGGDDEEVARFRREAQTAGRLHHPNIAAIYEVNEDQGRQYIAMQFVDGQNLHQFPRTDPDLPVRLVADAARALQYAHEQGVIHRDLKPENLMVTRRGEGVHLFLMDFGLARAAEGASKISATGFLVGTPMYMSPEQARGEKVDVRSDVYSLGLTLYELLTGQRPFESESVYETLRRVQEFDPPGIRQSEPRLAEDLETVVMKSISKDPAARYASAAALAEDLERFRAGEAIQGRRESLRRKLARRLRRHPWAFAAAGAIVAALAVSGMIARGASRDRRAANLAAQAEEVLRGREWTPDRLRAFDRTLADLARVDPAQEAALRARLPQAIADAIRGAELARARQELVLLEQVDPVLAARIGAEVRQRESTWAPLFRLEPPFAETEAVFEPGQVRADGDRLRCQVPGVLRTRRKCDGNVELKAEFDGNWKDASQAGLLFQPGQPSGYGFSMLAPEAPGLATFSAGRLAKVPFRLQIRRGDVVLREDQVDPAGIDLEAPLRLLARREGDLLKVQVNDLPEVEFRDPFARRGDAGGVFAVDWPAGAGLRRLSATHQELPQRPSRLDVGDQEFLERRYEAALDRYAEAARGPDAGESRLEALYKQGLSALALRRDGEARKIFEGISAGFMAAPRGGETRWFFLADCELLLLDFRDPDGLERVASILDKLPEYGYSFETLGRLMPPDVRRQILDHLQTGSVAGAFHRRPEDHVARTEMAVRASELLEPVSQRGAWQYHGLMRAYMIMDRDVEALRTAERSFRTFGLAGEVLDDYCWILRRAGTPKNLEAALREIDRGLAVDPGHYVERARIHAGLKDWTAALQDLDAVEPHLRDYPTFAAARLVRGFVLEGLGRPRDHVEAAWRQGLAKNWRPAGEGRRFDPRDWSRGPAGMSMLHDWILASTLDDMSDADAEQLLSGLMALAGKDNPVFNKLMRPSMLRATWRSPRGREIARHVAFRDLPFSDLARFPLFLGWIEFVHEVCLRASEPLSPDQDELLWRMSGDIYEAYRQGTLSDRYLLPFGAIVAGNPNAPGLGWREVTTLLAGHPKIRGPLAYIFGQRYAKKGDSRTARMFFTSARADADREPLQPLLRRLAQESLEALASD